MPQIAEFLGGRLERQGLEPHRPGLVEGGGQEAQHLPRAQVGLHLVGPGVDERGELGQLAGLNTFPTLHLPKSAGVYAVPFFSKRAIAYLQQIKEMKSFEPEKKFGQAIKILLGYDWGVVKKEDLGVAYVKMGTQSTT